MDSPQQTRSVEDKQSKSNDDEIERKGFYLPVVSAKCNYKKGAHFEDEIIVKTTINESPLARLKIEYEVRRIKNNDFLE